MRRIGFSITDTRARPRWVALAAGLALLAVVGSGSGMGSRPSATASATQASAAPAATTRATLIAEAIATPTASPFPTPTLAEPPAADIEAALLTQQSWVAYKSAAYKFSISYPADWVVSETQAPGWAIFSGWDGSNLSISWRAITEGTGLAVVTNEVWAAMRDGGYTVDGYDGGVIAGLPSQILTVDGMTSQGAARHGIIGIVVTDTGRYRIEVWSRPGSNIQDVALYLAFVAGFAIT